MKVNLQLSEEGLGGGGAQNPDSDQIKKPTDYVIGSLVTVRVGLERVS